MGDLPDSATPDARLDRLMAELAELVEDYRRSPVITIPIAEAIAELEAVRHTVTGRLPYAPDEVGWVLSWCCILC